MTTKFLTNPSKYNNLPFVELKNKKYNVTTGWDKICNLIQTKVGDLGHDKTIIVVETYQGVLHEELISNLTTQLKPTKFIHSDSWFLSEQEVQQLVFPDVTEDRIFGRITNLRMVDFFDPTKVEKIKPNKVPVTVIPRGISIFARSVKEAVKRNEIKVTCEIKVNQTFKGMIPCLI